MRRSLLALIALFVAGLVLASALARPSQQACITGACAYLPLVQLPEPSPTPTIAPQPTLTPTQAPATVHVVSSRSFVQSTIRYVVGEVANGRSSAVYFVNISARFYDATNTLVAVEDGYTTLTMTAPGQKNPFKILLLNAPASIVRYDLSLTYQTSSILDYRSVTILSQQVRDNFGPEVFGELRNDQAREMRSVEVAVTFYDATGQVVDADFGFPAATTLAPNASSTYKVSTFDESLTFMSYTVQAEGYLAP